jgi:hypothetical protein
MTTDKCPSIEDLQEARKVFLRNEPRDLFYRVATELIELAIEGKTKVPLSEALAILLQTWNRAYYQFRPFDNRHFNEINCLVRKHAGEIITDFRTRSILSLCENDKDKVYRIFDTFEQVLGPVGAAKSLHLLAPWFFPLWDRAITKAYSVPMGPVGTNAARYWSFIEISRKQCKTLDGTLSQENNPLKSIDEYNYCHYTKHWI